MTKDNSKLSTKAFSNRTFDFMLSNSFYMRIWNDVLEGVTGKALMIYIDSPCGIKYGSNFQLFVNKRDVTNRRKVL